MALDKSFYRQVLGHFTTGVAILTTRSSAGLAGMTINSFCSVSLSPPLVLVCVDRGSYTLPGLRESGIFVVNILTDQQEHLARGFARPSEARYKHFCYANYWLAATGAPVLSDALAFVDVRIVNEHPGGDHVIMLGEVQAMGMGKHLLFADGTETRSARAESDTASEKADSVSPLTFYQGQYQRLQLTDQQAGSLLLDQQQYSLLDKNMAKLSV